MAKIIGNTTATPNPQPDWNQTDESKADYIKNKPGFGNLSSKDTIDVSDLSEYVSELFVGKKGSGDGAEVFNDYGGNEARGDYSHTEGLGTIAASDVQHVEGKYNIEDTINQYVHIVGGGDGPSVDDRKNIHTLDWDGNAVYEGSGSFKGSVTVDGKELATQESIDNEISRIDNKILEVEEKINKDNIYGIPETWEDVQNLVREGNAKKYFNIGDQLVCNHETYGELTWDIIGFDAETSATDPSLTHSMTLQLNNNCLPELPFFGYNIHLGSVKSDISDDINPKLISFIYDEFGYYDFLEFTNDQVIISGSELFIDLNQQVLIVTDSALTPIISYPITPFRGSTTGYMVILDSYIQRDSYMFEGDTGAYITQNYDNSVPHRFLNDDTSDFLYGIDSDFLGILEGVKKPLNTQKDKYITARFFLPSVSELHGDNPTDSSFLGEEYSSYEYYSSNSTIGVVNFEADAVRIKNSKNWWTRSGVIASIHDVHIVCADGSISVSNTLNTAALYPCCVIM